MTDLELTRPERVTDPFDIATYYDCCDSEELQWETPEEALADYFEGYMEPGLNTIALVNEHAPITVTAYERRQVDWGPLAEAAAATALDEWVEEYGGHDGYDAISDATRTDLARAFQATLARVLRDATPWRCELVATREYSAAEVEAILRETCPEWFEEEA